MRYVCIFFFFSSRRRHTRYWRDWSSDVCSSDLVPDGVPWFPDDVEAWSVRWVLLHLIEEIGRHAGHADIMRESIDGATMYELMAGAEGWPATDWLQPWTADRVSSGVTS